MGLSLRSRIKTPVIVAVLAFATVGAARLFFSSAAVNLVFIEAESVNPLSPALVVSDPEASGGSAVQFSAAQPSPTPTPPAGGRSTMYVQGGKLYSAAGEKVTLRGANEMFIWLSQSRWATTMAEISKSKANVVRIVWDTSGSAANLDTLMQSAITNKMIPMPELHDATGNIAGVPALVDYWVRPEVVAAIKKHEKWALLNIANEAGSGGVPDTTFLSTYKTAITRLRTAGYTVPLVIDATQWGMNYDQVWRTWTQLRDHDPIQNIVFSLHSYWDNADPRPLYESVTAKIAADNIPVIIGEGPTPLNASCQLNLHFEDLMQKLHQRDIGWIGWSWGAANNTGCTGRNEFDLTLDGMFGNWETTYAQTIVQSSPYSIVNTAVRPAEFR